MSCCEKFLAARTPWNNKELWLLEQKSECCGRKKTAHKKSRHRRKTTCCDADLRDNVMLKFAQAQSTTLTSAADFVNIIFGTTPCTLICPQTSLYFTVAGTTATVGTDIFFQVQLGKKHVDFGPFAMAGDWIFQVAVVFSNEFDGEAEIDVSFNSTNSSFGVTEIVSFHRSLYGKVEKTLVLARSADATVTQFALNEFVPPNFKNSKKCAVVPAATAIVAAHQSDDVTLPDGSEIALFEEAPTAVVATNVMAVETISGTASEDTALQFRFTVGTDSSAVIGPFAVLTGAWELQATFVVATDGQTMTVSVVFLSPPEAQTVVSSFALTPAQPYSATWDVFAEKADGEVHVLELDLAVDAAENNALDLCSSTAAAARTRAVSAVGRTGIGNNARAHSLIQREINANLTRNAAQPFVATGRILSSVIATYPQTGISFTIEVVGRRRYVDPNSVNRGANITTRVQFGTMIATASFSLGFAPIDINRRWSVGVIVTSSPQKINDLYDITSTFTIRQVGTGNRCSVTGGRTIVRPDVAAGETVSVASWWSQITVGPSIQSTVRLLRVGCTYI